MKVIKKFYTKEKEIVGDKDIWRDKETKIDGNVISNLFELIYPVGAIYTSVNNVNPNNLFGGTWVSFGAGKALVGVDPTDTDYNTVEKTGGSKTNTLTIANLPAHTHAFTGNATGSAGAHSHTITVNSGGSHSHTASSNSTGSHSHDHTDTTLGTSASSKFIARESYYGTTYVTRTTESAGSHSHSITVNSGGSHSHTASSNSTGAHTHTVSGSNANTGSGTAFNTVDPYITVYMWKRTA